MTQITWRNVSTFGDKTSSKHVPTSERILSKGFDSFNKVVQDQQDIRQENFDNTTRQNDLGIRANIEQLNDLATFNREKPNFAIAELKKRHGVQFTPDEVEKFENKQQNELRDKAYGVASQIGNQVANEASDTSVGGSAVYQSLLDQKMAPDEAEARASQWMDGAQRLQGKFDKVKSDNTQAALTTVRSGALPKDNEAITNIIAGLQADYADKGGLDTTLLTAELSRGLTGRTADTDREFLLDKRATTKSIANEYTNLTAQINQAVQSGDITAANPIVMSAVHPENQARLQTEFVEGLKQTMSLSSQQTSNLTGTLNKHMSLNKKRQNSFDAQIVQSNADLSKAYGFSVEDIAAAKTAYAADRDSNIIKDLSAGARETGLVQAIFNIQVNHGDNAVDDLALTYQSLLDGTDKLSGVPPEVAQAIMKKTMILNYGDNQNTWGRGTGVDPDKLTQTVNQLRQNYLNAQNIRDTITQFQTDFATETEQNNTEMEAEIRARTSAYGAQNIGSNKSAADFRSQADAANANLKVLNQASSRFETALGDTIDELNALTAAQNSSNNDDNIVTKKVSGKIASSNPYSKLNNYTEIKIKNGYLFGKNKHGQSKQILKIPSRTFFNRDADKNPSENVAVNPKYADYLKAIKQLNIN